MDLDSLWWLGALIYVTGSVLINLGSNLIRKNHEDISGLEVAPPLYRRYLWLAGFSIFAVGNVMNFAAFAFAAQSLCAALGSVQFVSNLFFAAFINHEKVTRRDIGATCAIVFGNVLIVIFGSKESENYNLEELQELFLRPAFLIYIVALFLVIAVLQLLYWAAVVYLKRRYETADAEEPELMLADDSRMEAVAQRFIPFAYAAVSAMVGTNTILLGKVSAGLLVGMLSPDGWDMWLSPWTYGLIGLFLAVIAFWLYRMNTALKRYDALFIIPVLQTIWLLFGVLGGGIFFEEFAKMSAISSVFFFLGIIILLLGVSLLSPAQPGTADGAYANVVIEDDDTSWMVESMAEDEDLPAVEMAQLETGSWSVLDDVEDSESAISIDLPFDLPGSPLGERNSTGEKGGSEFGTDKAEEVELSLGVEDNEQASLVQE